MEKRELPTMGLRLIFRGLEKKDMGVRVELFVKKRRISELYK